MRRCGRPVHMSSMQGQARAHAGENLTTADTPCPECGSPLGSNGEHCETCALVFANELDDPTESHRQRGSAPTDKDPFSGSVIVRTRSAPAAGLSVMEAEFMELVDGKKSL